MPVDAVAGPGSVPPREDKGVEASKVAAEERAPTRRRGDIIARLRDPTSRGGAPGGGSLRTPFGWFGFPTPRRRRGSGHGVVPDVESQGTAMARLQSWAMDKRAYIHPDQVARKIARADILGDTRVQNPWAPTHVARTIKDPVKALEHGEREKKQKYSDSVLGFDLKGLFGVRFVPFVVSHMGILGKATQTFFRDEETRLIPIRGPRFTDQLPHTEKTSPRGPTNKGYTHAP